MKYSHEHQSNHTSPKWCATESSKVGQGPENIRQQMRQMQEQQKYAFSLSRPNFHFSPLILSNPITLDTSQAIRTLTIQT